MISGRRIGSAVALLALVALPGHVSAQREIVQPLPAPGERQLSDALSRLARNATDVGALLDAGEAALELNDIDAAIGFFGRANELSPGNSRTKVGLARAYTRSRRPVEALRLFAEAEAAGVADARGDVLERDVARRVHDHEPARRAGQAEARALGAAVLLQQLGVAAELVAAQVHGLPHNEENKNTDGATHDA